MKFKTRIWEQQKMWVNTEVYFEAKDLKDAETKIHEGNLQASIYDYGDYEICWEGTIDTVDYDYSMSIDYLEKIW